MSSKISLVPIVSLPATSPPVSVVFTYNPLLAFRATVLLSRSISSKVSFSPISLSLARSAPVLFTLIYWPFPAFKATVLLSASMSSKVSFSPISVLSEARAFSSALMYIPL